MYRSLQCLRVGLDEYINRSKLCTPKYLRGAEQVLKSYSGRDWEKYKKDKPLNNNQYGDYDRIPVMQTEHYSIYLMRWYPDSCTAIHRHSTAGCLYKIMEGSIFEQRFIEHQYNKDVRENISLLHLKSLPLEELKTRMTRYIDADSYHRMFTRLSYDSDPGTTIKNSYSLHIYGIDMHQISDQSNLQWTFEKYKRPVNLKDTLV